MKTNGKYTPFDKSSEAEWGINGCIYEPCTNIFKTRDSAINSVRCVIGMFDDPSRGQQECNNIEIHKKICNLYNGDFSDRFKRQDEMCILLTGTMFNPNDVFSTEIEKAVDKGYEVDERFRDVKVCDGGNVIVVLNDCEDDYGNSAYPEMISDEQLKNKRESLPAYDYQCIWRQKPIPAEGLLFAYENLRVFDDYIDSDLSDYSKAYIDPTRRKARDFFAMPIVKMNGKHNCYDLVDVIFEQSASRDIYDKIIYKVSRHHIVELYYEENIDHSMGMMLNTKLEEAGINYCKVIPVWNNVNKMQRILDMADTIKRNIRFPSKTLAGPRTPIGFAVRWLTEFDGNKSEHDDMPDALAGLAQAIIVNNRKRNVLKSRNKLPI